MPGLPILVWLLVGAIIAIAVVITLHTLASRANYDIGMHTLRVRTLQLRDEYDARLALLHAQQSGHYPTVRLDNSREGMVDVLDESDIIDELAPVAPTADAAGEPPLRAAA